MSTDGPYHSPDSLAFMAKMGVAFDRDIIAIEPAPLTKAQLEKRKRGHGGTPARGPIIATRPNAEAPPSHALKRAKRWLRRARLGDVPPSHVAETLAAANMRGG